MKVARRVQAVIAGFAACVMTVALSGCVVHLADSGEVGFKQSTTWGFYSLATETKAESKAELKSQPVVDWLTGDTENVETGEENVETEDQAIGEDAADGG